MKIIFALIHNMCSAKNKRYRLFNIKYSSSNYVSSYI